MIEKNKNIFGISFIVSLTIISCIPNQQEKQSVNNIGLDKQVEIPFFSTDSIVSKDNTLILYFTDSLPFFNPTLNGQAVAIKCEQLNIKRKSFDKLVINSHMPIREDGDIQGFFTRIDYDKIIEIYFRRELNDFYNDLLQLNWETKDNYSKNFMTLFDRINMTFQKSIKTDNITEFPNGSDWYGYNCFIVFNKYFDEINRNEIGAAHKVIESLYNNPNPYITENDLKNIFELIEKYFKN